MSKNIAIIGTRGAGKSVFVTVLAKHLSTSKKGVTLIPDSYEVDEYIDLNYATLQRGQWIPSTNVEQTLSWQLEAPGKAKQPVELMDIPGEDLQRLFARREYEKDDLLESDMGLVDNLLGSSTVLVLINLQDFLDDSYDESKIRSKKLKEHALKEFLTALRKDSKRKVAIVFTAYNQFRRLIEDDYDGIVEFLKKKSPAFFNAHIKGSGLPAFRVSAVRETQRSKHGSFPKPGFSHEGLDRVIDWLIDPDQYLSKLNQRKSKAKEKTGDATRETEPTSEKKTGETNADGPEWTDW